MSHKQADTQKVADPIREWSASKAVRQTAEKQSGTDGSTTVGPKIRVPRRLKVVCLKFHMSPILTCRKRR
jgi:hypothetical protein